jgi:hypothetical protein
MKKKSPTLALQGLFSFLTGTRRLCARAAMTAGILNFSVFGRVERIFSADPGGKLDAFLVQQI